MGWLPKANRGRWLVTDGQWSYGIFNSDDTALLVWFGAEKLSKYDNITAMFGVYPSEVYYRGNVIIESHPSIGYLHIMFACPFAGGILRVLGYNVSGRASLCYALLLCDYDDCFISCITEIGTYGESAFNANLLLGVRYGFLPRIRG